MTSRRNNGRMVAIGLIALCLAGFFATVWNYSRTHPFSTSATLVQVGDKPLVEATFHYPIPANGQRIVLKITGDSLPARGGIVVERIAADTVLIAIDSAVDASLGASVTASVDGTVGPAPLK